METIISVRGLKYFYSGGNEALRGIHVDIKSGERIAVLGSNGAGKSTFFLNLNAVLTPDQGDILYRGKKMSRSKEDLTALRRAVGIVFQDADNQIIASTVMGEVSFGPMNLKLSKEEVNERVEEALRYMNLTEFRRRPPHYLSGGEKKRVTIADIIAMHSEVIIFDEPTASLDPVNAAMLEEVLEKLSAQGKTLLISTHDIDFAYRWADRILIFCEGEIIADDLPEAVFEDEEVLRRSNLKKPTLLEVCALLREKGILQGEGCPKSVEGLRDIL